MRKYQVKFAACEINFIKSGQKEKDTVKKRNEVFLREISSEAVMLACSLVD